ncbi:MAG: hypothetical protein EHM61_03680 [Acidobacteria bacterium]|nr:MAG: hypothetical protein EHM61_03680 [Acidobacteriota bacterium]
MKLSLACLLLLSILSFAAAADLTGHWAGQAEVTAPDGTFHSLPVFLDLKQEGDKVSGSGGSESGDSLPLENVQFDGTKLSFSVSGPDGRTYKSDLSLVSSERLEGKLTFTMGDGAELTAKMTVTRAAAK